MPEKALKAHFMTKMIIILILISGISCQKEGAPSNCQILETRLKCFLNEMPELPYHNPSLEMNLKHRADGICNYKAPLAIDFSIYRITRTHYKDIVDEINSDCGGYVWKEEQICHAIGLKKRLGRQ